MNNETNATTPNHYDPRCRAWYEEQHMSDFPVFTEIYRFAQNNKLGITNCVPVWDLFHSSYHGAYCMDMYPTSDDKSFMDRYY